MEIKTLPTDLPIKGIFESGKIFIDGKELNPGFSLQIRNHSPDGFSWGYGGSGPSQLALAILLIFMSPEDAVKYYQDFKWNVVSKWPREDFDKTVNIRAQVQNIQSMAIHQ